MIELKSHIGISNFSDRTKDSVFVDRVYQMLVEDGIPLNYGHFISKFYKNGMIKVLKSLGVYQVVGRAENKKIFVHPRILIIIDTTIVEPEQIGRNIVRLTNKEYDMTPFCINDIDIVSFNNLEMSMAEKEEGNYATYLIKNPHNGLVKVGRSKNVFKRFLKLKNEFSQDLIFVGFCKKDFESEIHFEYKDLRVFGEWFNLSSNDILDIYSKYLFKELNELSSEANILKAIETYGN